jgi:hypothetical protein
MAQMNSTFGTPAYKLARSDSPETSKKAARSVDTTKMEKFCLDIIKSFGEEGCISDQVRHKAVELTGNPVLFQSITCRYSGLIEKGLITASETETRVGNSNRKQRVMRAVV